MSEEPQPPGDAPSGELAFGVRSAYARSKPERQRRVLRFAGLMLGWAVVLVLICIALQAAGIQILPPSEGLGTLKRYESVEIYRTRAATEDESDRLALHLRDIGFMDGNPKTVQLGRDGESMVVSFCLKDGAWDNPEVVETFRAEAQAMSQQVFAGRRVRIHLCDKGIRWGLFPTSLQVRKVVD